MTTVRTILVPVDFTAGSLVALHHARGLAAIFHSKVHLLHVASGPVAPAWAAERFGSHPWPLPDQDRIEALDRLATLIVTLGFDPFRTTGLVRTGSADEVVAQYADEIHADLIVMGTHGDHATTPVAVGRVVGRVLGRVSCPVLTIPQPPVRVAHFDVPCEFAAAIAS